MKQFLILTLASLSTVACSTISHGSRQTLLVESTPSGAEVVVRCGEAALTSGTTPARITVRRKTDPCLLTLRREGYIEKQISLERRFHWTFGAISRP